MTNMIGAYATHLAAEGMRPATVVTYVSSVNCFIRSLEGDLSGLTAADVSTYAKSISDQAGVRSRMIAVRGFVHWLAEQGAIPQGELAMLPDLPPRHKSVPRRAQEDDIDLILKHASPKFRPAILLMSDVGLRVGEVERLRWRDIHDDGNMRVRRKGGNHQMLPWDLTTRLAEAIKSAPRRGEYVIPGKGGRGPVSAGTIRRAMQRFADAAGVPSANPRNPHSLRHSFAVRAIGDRVQTPFLQRALGHSSLATTEQYLTTLGDGADDIRDAFSRGGE